MKITRIGPSFPLLTASTLGSSGTISPAVGSSLVPISNGSNGWAWGSNVERITAGGSNVLGPIVNFAAGSNVTLTIDQLGAVGSNTIRIHATGGAVSFGSNSNQVSYANAPGASTDSSRADHVHMGLTSLAHSSNTFTGPVILTASGSLGITSPAPGTYNLSSSGSGGGGSGGAPTTAKYVTTAADGTLSAEVVRPQLANYYAETPPTSADATYDDEFDDGSGMSGTVNGLAAKWAWRNQSTSTITYGKQGWATMAIPASASAAFRIIEIASVADGTYEACISSDSAIAGDAGSGMVIIDRTNGDFYFFGFISVAGALSVYVQSWSSVTAWSANLASVGYNGTRLYLRFVKSGTAHEAWWSNDGIGYRRLHTWTSGVGENGIGLGAYETGNTGLTKLHADYFRKVA